MKSKISSKTTLAELGAIVSEALRKEDVEAFLSGGAVVSIYTKNKYESFDLDFISMDDRKKIKKCMVELGFSQEKSRHFIHPETQFFVEFPGSAMKVGDELIKELSELKTRYGVLKLLTPTDCVKDRLAAYYHWNDPQSLDQAVWVARAHPIKIESVRKWSESEGMREKFAKFLERISSKRKV
jgi:hypothetical protein